MRHPEHPEAATIALPVPERVFAPGDRGRARVTSEKGYAEVELRAGALDDNALFAFSCGQCHALAAAVHERTGWPVFALARGNGRAEDPRVPLDHLYVRTPDGRALDVTGAHDVRDFVGADGWRAARGRNSIVPVAGERLRGLLAGDGDFLPAELDLARSFVEPVLAYVDGEETVALAPGTFKRRGWSGHAPDTHLAPVVDVTLRRIEDTPVRLRAGTWSDAHAAACSGVESLALMRATRKVLDESPAGASATVRHLYVDGRFRYALVDCGDGFGYTPYGVAELDELDGELRDDAPAEAYAAFARLDFDATELLVPGYLRHTGIRSAIGGRAPARG